MSSLRKYLLFPFVRFLECFALFICSYIVYVTVCLLIPVNSEYFYSEKEVQFYVISNGIHTDICLPVNTQYCDWTKFINPKDFCDFHQTPEFISIGWGDKGFYLDTPTWADLKASTLLKAAFLPSETAMHVSYLSAEPIEDESTVLCSMSLEEYKSLLDFVLGSFEQKEKESGGFNPILIEGKGYSNNDNFYEANHSYHFMKTCNTWTSESLKIAGVRTSIHALFERGVLRWID